MAANNLGLEFVLKGDGSVALNAINNVQKGINKLGDSVKNELTSKLKTLVGVGALGEMARRTQEWAYNTKQLAQALGLTTSDAQIFDILGNNATLAEGKVTEFYTSFANARDEAIKGNADMIQSLQALGISFSDLTSHAPTATLFEKFLGNKDLLNVQQGSAMSRAVANVFGAGNLYNLQSLIRTAPANALNPANYPNQIVPDKDVAELSALWTETKNNLKKIFTESIPAIKIIVEIINTVIKAVLGMIDAIRDMAEIGSGIVHGDTKKIMDGLKHLGVELSNSVLGLLKSITGIIDGLANIVVTWANKIPGLKGHVSWKPITADITKAQDWIEGKAGFTGADQKIRRENAEAVGAVAPMLVGAGAVKGVLEKVLGKASTGLFGAAVRAEELAGSSALAGRAVTASMLTKASEGLLKMATVAEKIAPLSKVISAIGGILGLSGAAIMGATSSALSGAGAVPNVRPGYNAQIIQQNPFAAQGESNQFLRIGGVFGTGIQMRMIRLTEQMISILNQIQRNTTYIANPYTVNPNNLPAGGQ